LERLNRTSHHLIAIVMSLAIFICGVLLGVKLAGTTQGTQGMIILVFAFGFLAVALLFILFTQLVHIRESLTELHAGQKRRRG
jgi:uncharacterized Tic20 family protein